jgi:LPXTG-motif cell wall-anchored protein
MKKRLMFGFVLVAGAVAVPSAAYAVPGGEEPGFVAVSELDSSGTVVSVPAHAGETVALATGVAYNNRINPRGAVVHIRTVDDVALPKTFTNCWYYTNTNLQGGWCRFEETIQAAQPYELAGFQVTVAPEATGKLDAVVLQWFGGGYDEQHGGLEALAKAEAGPGTTPGPGDGGKQLLLTKSSRLKMTSGSPTGFAYVHLVEGEPTTAPATTTPATAPTEQPADVPTTPAPVGGVAAGEEPPAASGAGDDGGLPITGSKTAAFAGAGVLLVAAGLAGALVARRRRTRFVA